MSSRRACTVLSTVLSTLPLWLYSPWCVALEPGVEQLLKPKVSAALLQLLRSDSAVDLARVCENAVATDGKTQFKPQPLPDIVVHLRAGSASLAAASLVPEPKLEEGKWVYVKRDTGLGFIVVRVEGARADQRPAVIALASHADVRRVEPNCRYRDAKRSDARAARARQGRAFASSRAAGTDPLLGEQWGLNLLQAPEVWRKTVPGIRPLVAVLDTGVDCSNPELKGQLQTSSPGIVWPSSPQEPCPSGVGWDFVEDDADPSHCGGTGVCNAHGTHMGAIIAARTGNGLGIAAVAPNAMLLIVRTTDEADVPTDDVNRAFAIKYAVDQEAKILNISQQWPNWASEAMQSALCYAKERLVNIATGNQGSPLGAGPPNVFDNVTYVMALKTPHLLYSGSNRVCWARRSILAPGFLIHGAIVNGNVEKVSGTSPATAFLSGAYALLESLPAHQNDTALQIHELLFDSVPKVQFSIDGGSQQCQPQLLCLAFLTGGQCP